MKKIKIGIIGYGNIGRGVELAVRQNDDMELTTIFTRRDPATVPVLTDGVAVCTMDQLAAKKEQIDVAILCGGSATDLPVQGPQLAALFHTVDSFDTHARIPAYFATMDQAAKSVGNLSVISVGWDPGMFSLNRLLGEAILPQGSTYTFWGKGVSQGHSDALRRVPGVKTAIQYTVPVESAVEAARSGEEPELTTRQKHTRACFVVTQPGADHAQITKTIQEMPNYFADYDTSVTFLSEEDFRRDHQAMPHGGFVIRSGKTGAALEHNQVVEYSLNLVSNPEFTASILVSYARAAYCLAQRGETGARTVLDIAPGLLSPKSAEQLRAELL